MEPDGTNADAALPARLDGAARHVATACGEGRMAWRIWGSGPAIVLLHGGHGSWEHWIRNIGPLAARGRVIAGDLPGLGDSDALPPPVDAPRLAEVVAAGIRELAPDGPLALAGFSVGSVITAHTALALGQRVRRVFLLGPAGLGDHWRDSNDGMLRRPYRAPEAEQRAVVRHNLGVSMIGHPDAVDDLALDIQYRLTSRRRRLIGMPISASSALLDALPALESRTHVIAGEHDRYLLPDAVRCLQDLGHMFPALRTTLVREAGHWVAYDGARTVNPLLLDALDPV